MNRHALEQDKLPIQTRWQVVVIGAGVAGALAALRCVRGGFATLLVDKQSFPRHKVCGCCLNAKAWSSLANAGLESELADSATEIQTTRFHVGGSQTTVRLTGMRAVSRAKLDSLLVSAFVDAGGTFASETTATVLAESDRPRIQLQRHKESMIATADIVLACDGLGHPSLKMLPEFKSRVRKASRVGVGAVVPRSAKDAAFPANELQMAVGRSGYVGTVAVEDDHLSVAAAVDASVLKSGRSPFEILKTIYSSNGLPIPTNLNSASIKGTLPLTRSTSPVALRRIFLLGDAVGYVEPFTGEGMAWAMTSADSVLPLVSDVVANGWEPALSTKWAMLLGRDVRRRQRICRVLSRSLRSPWLLSPMLNAFRLFPAAAESLVRRMNHVPAAKKV